MTMKDLGRSRSTTIKAPYNQWLCGTLIDQRSVGSYKCDFIKVYRVLVPNCPTSQGLPPVLYDVGNFELICGTYTIRAV
ncbi:hypothetical protein MAR_031594 [Mya arenaria]|uniref:Uncharacterized protein n=1 Tax=Mya arenaria TaxID=6604 RepID=A0ABY7F497_MYAAR|nr:hypothetical protein MAR_031594 [Mya arenaria]